MKYNYSYIYKRSLDDNELLPIDAMATFDKKGNIRIDYIRVFEDGLYSNLKVEKINETIEERGIITFKCSVKSTIEKEL